MEVAMGIKDQIFEEFFAKLAVEDEVPTTVVTELMSLATGGQSISEKELLGIIERGFEDGNENKEV